MAFFSVAFLEKSGGQGMSEKFTPSCEDIFLEMNCLYQDKI